jgi:hypothetical protein
MIGADAKSSLANRLLKYSRFGMLVQIQFTMHS